MQMLYLSKQDIQHLGVTMAQIISAVSDALKLKSEGKVQMPPKSAIRPVADSFVHAMPVYVDGSEICGVKWISGYRSNIEKNLAYINGLLILSNASNGLPIAVMDGTEITALRTGAMVGIAAKHLARMDSSVVGILGCGVQARKSLIALMEVMREIKYVRCYDIAPEAMGQFIAEMEGMFPLTSFVTCDSPADMAHFSDVVVSATPIRDVPNPSLDAGMLKKGGLAIALDYDAAWTPAAMNECNRIVTDDVEQFTFTKQEGLHFSELAGDSYLDLSDVVAGKSKGRETDDESVMCLNLGVAVADIAAAKVLYDRALKHQIGTYLPL
jgi:ornithine cyclodeaminase/alanine dehydrogenase-like protein (mu-crystallin family)